MAESFITLSSAVTWRVENVCNKLGDLPREIPKESVESLSSFLANYIKCKKDSYTKGRIVRQKETKS